MFRRVPLVRTYGPSSAVPLPAKFRPIDTRKKQLKWATQRKNSFVAYTVTNSRCVAQLDVKSQSTGVGGKAIWCKRVCYRRSPGSEKRPTSCSASRTCADHGFSDMRIQFFVLDLLPGLRWRDVNTAARLICTTWQNGQNGDLDVVRPIPGLVPTLSERAGTKPILKQRY